MTLKDIEAEESADIQQAMEFDWFAERDLGWELSDFKGYKDWMRHVERLEQELAQLTKERDDWKRKYDFIHDDPETAQCCALREKAEQELATATARIRISCQLIIESIGSVSPEDLESALGRLVAAYERYKEAP